MTDKQQLMDMGFEERRVDWALHAAKGGGLQAATDHLVENSERPVPDFEQEAQEEDAAVAAAHGGEAKSMKCLDCGKVMRNTALASFHAEKSGHTNFEESTEELKPLTEEEKKERLEEMRKRLAEKRSVQSKEDVQTQRENEKIRRKAGQEMGSAREDLKLKEANREAEKRKQEKKADAEAKKRVREQIEADKRERAERAAREKALREGRTDEAMPAQQPSAAAAAAAARPVAPASASNESRLRVRAPGGTWMGTLTADRTLADVEAKILADGKAQSSLNFSLTFPRKVLAGADKQKSLRELGLVPNAALEASHT